MSIFKSIFNGLIMTWQQKKLIKKGHSVEEAMFITMVDKLTEENKKMGFSEKESYEMAQAKAAYLLAGK